MLTDKAFPTAEGHATAVRTLPIPSANSWKTWSDADKQYIKEDGKTYARSNYFQGRCAVLCMVLLLKISHEGDVKCTDGRKEKEKSNKIMDARLQKSSI